MLLESIHSPADVRALPEGQLPQLCQELREFLVKSVSETGGHLASNLGAVEQIGRASCRERVSHQV